MEGGELFYITSDDESFSKQKLDPSKPYATGSGQHHALTAMDMGATAKEAVKMAIMRDTNSGGRIRTYKI